MSANKQGRLVIFEGIDHVGKSTISAEVFEELKRRGVPCAHYSFPGKKDGTLGKIVYDIHHDKGGIPAAEVNPVSLQILHIAAHIDALTRDILPDVRAGKTVVLDRFWWSTYAYGIGDGLSEQLLTQIISPEITCLDGMNDIRFIYVRRKEKESDFTSEKTSRILRAYDCLCDKTDEKHLLVIDNDGTIANAVEAAIRFVAVGGSGK